MPDPMTPQTTRLWSEIVEEARGTAPENHKPEPAYEFSNGRTFDQPPDPYGNPAQ